MFIGFDQAAATETRHYLSVMGVCKARRTAFLPGEVE